MRVRPQLRAKLLGFAVTVLAVLVAREVDARSGGPDFNEQDALALATDIVEVVPVNVAGEPSYRVIGVWRGGLEVDYVFKPGALSLEVGQVHWYVQGQEQLYGFQLNPPRPKAIKPTSTVLYLRDSEAVEDDRLGKEKEQAYGKPLSRWIPANRHALGSFGLAALYLADDGKAYELHGSMFGGIDKQFVPQSYRSLASYKIRVKQYDLLSDWLTRAQDAQSIQQVVEVYGSAVDQGFKGLIDRAHDTLAGMGPPVFTPVRSMLLSYPAYNDPAYLKERARLLDLLAQADRKAAQVVFWRQVEVARHQFGLLIEGETGQQRIANMVKHNVGEDWQQYEALVTALKHLDPPSAKRWIELLQAVRQQWSDDHLRIPEDKRYLGLDVVEQCDRLLGRKVE